MLNVNAKEFFPLEVIVENEMFDKLEDDFVENNEWLFNYEFQDNENIKNIDIGKYYYGIKNDKEEQPVLKKDNFKLKLQVIQEEITYADMLKNKK